MPVYEYSCNQCGQVTEALQKFSDPPLEVCGKCNGKLSKLISRTSFQLKGTGWYASDYKKPTETAAPSTTEKPASEATTPSAEKAESQSKPKPEPVPTTANNKKEKPGT
jgi:putative FmdB family regulatory protein